MKIAVRFLGLFLFAALVTHCGRGMSPSTSAKSSTVVPVSEATLGALTQSFYNRRTPQRIKAFASLYIQAPHQKPFFWEGALLLDRPSVLTFEAINELGNTLFYFRFTQAHGWVLEYGDDDVPIDLPTSGAEFVSLLMGRPPIPSRDSKQVLRTASASTNSPLELKSQNTQWTFSSIYQPLYYQVRTGSARRSYEVRWDRWREKSGMAYPGEIDFRNLNGSLQLRIIFRDIELW